MNRRPKIGPIRITLLDQRDFPRSAPPLEFLLAKNGLFDIAMNFKVDQPINTVPFGKSAELASPMSMNTRFQITGNPYVKSPVTLACHDVNK